MTDSPYNNFPASLGNVTFGGGASAAPVYGATTSAAQNSGTSLSFAGPTVSGTNTLMLVTLAYRAHNNPTAHATAVTLAGTSLQLLTRTTGADRNTEIWYRVGPPAGASTVAITMSLDPEDLVATATYYTGVNQTTPVGTAAGNSSAGSTTPSVGASASGTFDLMFGVAATYPASFTNTVTANSPAISRSSVSSAGANIESSVAETVGSAGTVSISWTATQSFAWAASGVAIHPVAIASTSMITPGGKAGIGTGANPPAGAFVVQSTLGGTLVMSDSTAVALTAGTNGTASVESDLYLSAATMTFQPQGVAQMKLDSSGHLGLGTVTPNGRLHVRTAAGANLVVNDGGPDLVMLALNNNGTTRQGISLDASYFQVFTNAVQIFRVDGNGNVWTTASAVHPAINSLGQCVYA